MNERDYNIGKSDYAKHRIQPIDIIEQYYLSFYEGNMLKYLLRKKEDRKQDILKIRHYAFLMRRHLGVPGCIVYGMREAIMKCSKDFDPKFTIEEIINEYSLNFNEQLLLVDILKCELTSRRQVMEKIVQICDLMLKEM